MADKWQMAVSDGLPMRESGAWAEEKLDYLRRYVDVFTTSMRKKWSLYYLDLFAGPGKCQVRETGRVLLGSPLIALTSRYPFTAYYFVDLKQENLDTLRRRCQSSGLYERVQFVCHDANDAAVGIVNDMHGRLSALGLAFLDPEGLELRWETVTTLAQLRLDLIIHFSQMGLARFMPVAAQQERETALDLFFGDREWRSIFERSQRREEFYLLGELVEYYQSKLQRLGYQDTNVSFDPVMKNRNDAPLYRLLFASKNKLGADFWAKVTARDAYGQRRLLELEPPYE